jgi:hypothetical protein
MVKALADRLAEASAEWLHARARADCGYGADERLSSEDLIAERYRGIRPAFGYPACPDHSEKYKLFDLLQADRAGISLTESAAMAPAASVSGLYFAHPQARYFTVGRIGRDQVEDYAARKGMGVEEASAGCAPTWGTIDRILMEYLIKQYPLETGALEIQYIEEYFGEFPRKKTAAEITARLRDREFLILIAEARLPDDPAWSRPSRSRSCTKSACTRANPSSSTWWPPPRQHRLRRPQGAL